MDSPIKGRLRESEQASATTIKASGGGDAFDAALEDIADNRFIRGDRFESVGAGEVDQSGGDAIEGEAGFASFDGDPGIISDPGAHSRERVKERGFACVRAADESENIASRLET